ncbi:ATP-dependent DNA helicase [Caligus rogercresseyi]|uniref:ATP-dependent DNA helicase n=1 Tax=Caligus rogercresseyi TaxID=217165 RepID=A0A7T8JWX9_CALRO|nr:ATP-dependent DNA helicase [Caligus rogercresseyi]
MTEEILLQARCQADDEYPQFTPTMYNQALIFLEDKVLEIDGCSLDDYALTTPDRIQQRHISRRMLRDTSYANDLLQQYVDDNEPLHIPDQTDAYTKIMLKVNSGSAGILFLDALAELAKVRQNNQITLGVASSGIAATLLSGVEQRTRQNPVCSIRKGTDEANVLQETRLIVWDEAIMAHKNALHALDKSLKDIRSIDSLFGGVVLQLAGDFRQTLPIIPRGTPPDEINASDTFPSTLPQIGNGQLPQDQDGYISMAGIGNFVSTPQQLCHTVYPNLNENHANHEWLFERAILAPTNETVGNMYSNLLKQIPGEERSYSSVTHYPTEFLDSLDPSGLPPHVLTLKHGCPIMLLRNLDALRLCNGTHLIVKQMMAYIIEATIITGQGKEQSVFIPRIPLIPSDCHFPFKRLQFPFRPCFTMTINKAQGKSLRVVGLDFHTPRFSHGQIYVGCSRVGESTSLHIHALDQKTKNVFYPSVLQ